MNEQEYYEKIENYIKKNEVNKKRRVLEENYDTLRNNWEIGKLLVEAQGGKKRAKYGNELIKKWSIKYTKNYGKGYSYPNLKKFKKFYLLFPKGSTLSSELSWSHIVEILPIKDENKRNYYINEVILKNWSIRKLREEIKANSYERLIDKPEHIEIVQTNWKPTLFQGMKNPIIIKTNKIITTEKELETTILAELAFFFEQLGGSYALVGNQYKLAKGNKNYYIDLLLLNYKLNCFIVVDLKLRELKKEDKAQIEFYMKLVDEEIKEAYQNKTIGIIISKEQEQYVANFVRNDSLIPLVYEFEKTSAC